MYLVFYRIICIYFLKGGRGKEPIKVLALPGSMELQTTEDTLVPPITTPPPIFDELPSLSLFHEVTGMVLLLLDVGRPNEVPGEGCAAEFWPAATAAAATAAAWDCIKPCICKLAAAAATAIIGIIFSDLLYVAGSGQTTVTSIHLRAVTSAGS
ncbi:hypothetical protein GQX74_007827 [Glossina fuscipes]|nr:hypothetical protein GQX74_007827 [Glossina fuscipes]